MIILDTDHVTLLQWGKVEAGNIRQRLDRMGIQKVATSIITYEEQTRGWISELGKAKSMQHQIQIYARLRAQLRFYESLEIFDFTDRAAVEFQRLLKLKLRLGTMDLKIASVAIAFGATLLTRNVVDFAKVPNLDFDDASK